MSKENLLKIYRNRVAEAKESFIDVAASQIAYDMLNGEKYEITHAYDPPYDHSGSAFRTGESLNIDDYETLEDFFREPTGQTRATYVSNYGLHHMTYGDAYEDMIMDFFYTTFLDSVIADLANDCPDYFLDLINQNAYEKYDTLNLDEMDRSEVVDSILDEVGVEFPDLQFALMDSLLSLNTKLMFNRGKESAIMRMRERDEAHRIWKEKRDKEFAIATNVEDKMRKLYKLRFGREFKHVNKTDLEHYREFLQLLMESFATIEMNYLGKYYPNLFSNSVAYELMVLEKNYS